MTTNEWSDVTNTVNPKQNYWVNYMLFELGNGPFKDLCLYESRRLDLTE